MTDTVDQKRRRWLGATAWGIAAAPFVLNTSTVMSAAHAAPAVPAKKTASGGNVTSFKTLKQIKAGSLDVGYAEDGPANGTPVILLHGWPYDIHSFV